MRKFVYLLATSGILATTYPAEAAFLRVTVESLAPNNGVYFTPVWVGFHNGSFDSYDNGLAAAEGLERLAEDGDTSVISADFTNNLTYVNTGLTQGGIRVDGTIGSAPIAPNQTVSQLFEISEDESNRYFSYASMILPTNDYFIANGNPTGIDLSHLFNNIGGSISFDIGNSVNEAGTEINDFDFSAGNPLFGIAGGQSGGNQGNEQNGVITNVTNPTDPFTDFLNRPAGFDFNPLNFNNDTLYPNGIARVTITSVNVPESSPINGLFLLGVLGILGKMGQSNKGKS